MTPGKDAAFTSDTILDMQQDTGLAMNHQAGSPLHRDLPDAVPLLPAHTASPSSPLNGNSNVNKQSASKHTFWSNGIASLTVQTEDATARVAASTAGVSRSSGHSTATRKVPSSRWGTWEYRAYMVILLVGTWRLALSPIRLSQESHPNYWIFEKRLSDGWIAGRKVDNTDSQFRQFRNGLPALITLAVAYLIASRLYTYFSARRRKSYSANPHAAPYERIPFLAVSALVVLFVLHGTSAFKILVILYINYKIPQVAGTARITPLLVWSFNLGILFCNEIFDGYRYGSVLPFLSLLDSRPLQGVIPRWHIPFNMSMLRMVSFSMDLYWHRPRTAPPTQSGQPSSGSDRDYTWNNYVAYVLYPPLYIAGPIITFDSWINQVKSQSRIPPKTIIAYLSRFVVCFLTMELILHYMYVVAIKDSYAVQHVDGQNIRIPAWQGDTPAQLAMMSFWNLIVVWLKLLLPWRFFRLWSLIDGIDPPENMIRCMLNNYSPRGFWRSWHRSYNLWLIRYLYVPVVKNTNVLVATLVTFTFVALWHDLSLKLLTWGWLITLFVVPEMIGAALLPESKYGHEPWYRHVCALGAVANIMMMVTANTIGFVLGPQNTLTFLKAVFGTWQGILFIPQAALFFFSLSQVMFEYREEELRHGIKRKC